MINFWKLAYKSVKEQRDQYEEENEQLKAERDALINELYTVGLNRDEVGDKIKELEHENKALRLQADTYFDEWQNEKVKKEDSLDDLLK